MSEFRKVKSRHKIVSTIKKLGVGRTIVLQTHILSPSHVNAFCPPGGSLRDCWDPDAEAIYQARYGFDEFRCLKSPDVNRGRRTREKCGSGAQRTEEKRGSVYRYNRTRLRIYVQCLGKSIWAGLVQGFPDLCEVPDVTGDDGESLSDGEQSNLDDDESSEDANEDSALTNHTIVTVTTVTRPTSHFLSPRSLRFAPALPLIEAL